MIVARPALALVALAISLGGSGCASIIRGARADISFNNAPQSLQVFEEDGTPIDLDAQGDGKLHGQIGYKTRKLTLKSSGASAEVELDTRVSLGYLICDFLLDVFPMIIDFATSKWTNFEDVDVGVAMGPKSGALVSGDPWKARVVDASASAPDPWKSSGGKPPPAKSDKPSHQEGRALVQPASPSKSLVAVNSAQTSASPPAIAPPTATGRPLVNSGKLAVLDFKSYTDALKPEDVRYFSDVVRGAMLRSAPNLQVITRENLLVLLQATGKDAANCEGECEVETGRRIGADSVVSGEMLKVGSHFKLSLKLHETHDGRLLSTSVASGRSIDELDASAQAAALELIAPSR